MEVRRRRAIEMMDAGQKVPATKRDLAFVESSLTREMANLRNELCQSIAELRAHAIRREVRDQCEGIGREIVGEMRKLRREFRTIKWMAATTLAAMALTTSGIIALALS